MPQFRVVWLHDGLTSGENYGNHLQRIVRPCELWADDAEFDVAAVAITDANAAAEAMAADLLVIVQLSQIPIEGIIRQRRRLGRPTVYEINDDISQIGDCFEADGLPRSVLPVQQLYHAAAACDAVQFASSGQCLRFASLHPHRHVLHSYVPAPAVMPGKPPGFVVGWAGTNTHLDDLLSVAPALSGFLQAHSAARFAMMGDLDRLQPVLRQLPAGQLLLRPFGRYEDLQDFLAGIHAGIAPMKDTGFNRGRSDGKYAQYAAAGAVALLADCAVFAPHRQRAQLFSSPEELVGQLTTLYIERAGLRARAAAAFNWVRRCRSREALHAFARQQFRGLLGDRAPLQRRVCVAPPAELPGLLTEARKAANNGCGEDSVSYCREALRIAPDCHAARWLALSVLAGLKRHTEVLNLVDDAPHDPLYAEHYAFLAYASATHVCPSRQQDFFQRVASPSRRQRLIGVQPGAVDSYYRAILTHEPYDYFALFGLIGLLRGHDPHHRELPVLLERAELLAPKVAHAMRAN